MLNRDRDSLPRFLTLKDEIILQKMAKKFGDIKKMRTFASAFKENA